ncbi:MAG: DUF4249 family protein [Deltaproteobacteria bacterium]
MKKHFYKYNPLTFFLLLILSSCERPFPVDNYSEPDKLVLNCFIDSDSTLQLDLSKSSSPYNEFKPHLQQSNAVLTLKDEKGQKINLTRQENSNLYKTGNKLKNGEIYSMNVEFEGFEDIRAYSLFPENVSDYSYSGQVIVNDDNQKVLYSKFSFNPNQNKYLIIRHTLKKKLISIKGDTVTYTDTSWVNPKSNNIEHVLPQNAVNKLLFVNIKGDGPEIVEFESYDGFEKNDNLIEGYSYFELISCSEQYYKYLKSLLQYYWNKNSADPGVFTPVTVFSNVENGHGIFAGFSTVIIEKKYK